MKLHFDHVRSTKSCEVFRHEFPLNEAGQPEQITLYLKKKQLWEEGISPARGLTVTIEEANHD